MPDYVVSYFSAQWWLFVHIGAPLLAVTFIGLAVWYHIERN